MSKKLNYNDFHQAVQPIWGPELTTYGLPYVGAPGFIRDPELIEEILHIVECDSTLHIASYQSVDNAFNKYISEKRFYRLCRGDSDPDLQLCPIATQVRNENLTSDELKKAAEQWKNFRREMDSELGRRIYSATLNSFLKK